MAINPIAVVVMLVLAILSALHLYWGLGGRWPGRDDQTMVERVVGRTAGMKAPGFWPSLGVAVALMASAIFVGWMCGIMARPHAPWSDGLVAAGFWASGSVFALRGVAGFVPGVFRYAAGTPFARLNVLFYSPLCLAIAAGYLAAYFAAE